MGRRSHADQQAAAQRDAGLSVARWSLLAVALALPLATSNLTGFGFARPFTANQVDLVKLLVMQAGLAVGYLGWGMHLFGPRPSVRTTPALWIAAAALALTVVSALLGLDPSASVLGRDPRYAGLISLAGFLALFFLASQVLRTRAEKRRLALAVTASAAAVAAYALAQHFGIDPADWGVTASTAARAASTFGNPVPLGTFLAGTVPIAAVLALSESDRRLRVAEWASFALQAVALAATFTRGAWLGGIVALGIVTLAAWRRRTRLSRIDVAALALAAVGVGVVVVLSFSSQQADTNAALRLRETADFTAGSAGERLLVWRTALAAVGERPLQGWGPEGFRWAYARLRPAEAVALNGPVALADDAHDYPLMLAATLGVPGMAATLGLLAFVLWLALASVFASRLEEGLSVQAGYAAAVAGMLASLLTGISASPALALMWLYAGALVPTFPVSRPRAVLAGRVLAGAASFAVVVGLVFVAGFVRADSLFVRGRSSASLDQRLSLYAAASAAAPRSDVYAQALGDTYATAAEQAIGQARALEAQGQDPTAAVKAATDYISQGVAALTRATAVAPAEPQNYVDLARLELLSGTNLDPGALARAEAAVTAGLERSPKAPHAIALHAQILLAQGRPEDALGEAERSVAIYRDAVTLATLGRVRLAAGDRTGAVEALEEAQKAAPDDKAIAAQLAEARAGK